MKQHKTDPCVYCKFHDGKEVLILKVHVDDMAVAGTMVLHVTFHSERRKGLSQHFTNRLHRDSCKTLRCVDGLRVSWIGLCEPRSKDGM